MSSILKTFLSMSLSGSLLIAALFLCKPLLKNRVRRQWQYYIWLIVIARLLLPFTPQESLMGTLFAQAEREISQRFSDDKAAKITEVSDVRSGEIPAAPDDKASGILAAPDDKVSGILTAPDGKASEIPAASLLWLAWLGPALVLLIRKITVYQNFTAYLKAGREEITDIERLDRLAQIGAMSGVKRPVELFKNRLVSSPLLTGFFHPCIILPDAGLPDADFEYTVRHELIHFKRLDMFYKWLVQITICLHWFNPLVWLMGRELGRACELACDEAVIQALDARERLAYGNTLLHAAGAGRNFKNSLSSVMLSENAQLLKERLDAIMKYKKSSHVMIALSAILTAVTMTGAVAAGAAVPARTPAKAVPAGKTVPAGKDSDTIAASLAEKYYKDGILPLFAAEFSELDESAQKTWLNKIYKNDEIAFFSVSLNELDENSPLLNAFAGKAYKDSNISFFSVLAGCMDKKTLESWLKKAEKDKQTAFQLIILDHLDCDWEQKKLEKELEKERLAEYKKYGIIRKGKAYYYKGKLVNIFMDVRKDSSFYTLDMNPKGTVNVKVTRGADNKIQSVGRMSEAEAEELFIDMK